DIPPQVQPGPSIDDILDLPTHPFVTITPAPGTIEQPNFELWFHLNLKPPTSNTVVIQNPVCRVFAEVDADTTLPISATIQIAPQRNVFNIRLDPVAWRETRFSKHLRFVFPVDNNAVRSPNTQPVSLRNYIKNN